MLSSPANLIKLWNHPVKSNWIFLCWDKRSKLPFLPLTKSNSFVNWIFYQLVLWVSETFTDWVCLYLQTEQFSWAYVGYWITPRWGRNVYTSCFDQNYIHTRKNISGHPWASVSSWHWPLGCGQQRDDSREAGLRPHQEHSCCLQVIIIFKKKQNERTYCTFSWQQLIPKLFSNICHWLQLNMQIVNHDWYISGKQTPVQTMKWLIFMIYNIYCIFRGLKKKVGEYQKLTGELPGLI